MNKRSTDRGSARRRIVIAEDHDELRAVVRTFLEEQQLQVVAEAGDGETALAAVLAYRPEVVLLDWRMPCMDGLEVARRLRYALPLTRVVVYTAETGPELHRKCRELGVFSVVNKSELPDVLAAAVLRAAASTPAG